MDNHQVVGAAAAAASLLRLRRWHAAVALCGAWALFFAGQLCSAGVPFFRDILLTALPLRQYINSRLRQGELPQWYPFESLGVPLIGQIATTLFHPATLFMLPLDAFNGVKYTLLLAYLLGLVGAYRLARLLPAARLPAVTAAIAYGFGGYALGVASILHYVISQATLPWIAVFGLRLLRQRRLKDGAYLALTWASVFLAGDAQGFFWCCGLLAALFLACPSARGAKLLLVAAATTVLLCGVEYMPARHVGERSLRGQGHATAFLNQVWALHPARLPEFLLAGFIPESVRDPFLAVLMDARGVFCTTLFVGCLVLFLAVAGMGQQGPWKRVFAAMAVVSLWLALGERGQLLPLMQRVLPILARFRYPEKYLAFFWLGLCGLVSMGAERVLQTPRFWNRMLCLAAVAGLALSAYVATRGVARPLWSALGQTLLADDPLPAVVDAAWAAGLMWVAIFCVLAAAILALGARRTWVQGLLPVALFVELWQGNAAHLPVMPVHFLASMPPFASIIHGTALANVPLARVRRQDIPFVPIGVTEASLEEQRLWTQSVRDMLVPDASGLYGITSIGVNLGGESVRHHRILSTYGKGAARYGAWFNACFNVKGLASPLATDQRELARDEETGMQLVSTPCKPRAFLSGTLSVHGMQAAVAALQQQQMTDDLVVWEDGPVVPMAKGHIAWVKWAPEHVAMDVEADGATALILSDDLAPGWTATLDDQPVAIYAAMVAGSGVVMPAGTHRLELRYRTPGLRTGAAMSFMGLLNVALLRFYPWHRRRQGSGNPANHSLS